MIKVLNLGAGVQSSAVLLMSCQGALPRLDAAIFADTGWEPSQVYEHLAWLESEAKKFSLPVFRVQCGNIRSDALHSQVRGRASGGVRWASMPLFTLGPNGNRGMIRRQCTSEYKIRPVERFIRRELLQLHPRQRAKPHSCEQWFGISWDEFTRMRTSRRSWTSFAYPLVEMRMTRKDCLAWLAAQRYPTPPRSSCIGCPFHSDAEWRDMKRNRPWEWDDAVAFDQAIRRCGGMRGEIFLHRSCVPLKDADLRTDGERGQLSLWEDECSGMCAT